MPSRRQFLGATGVSALGVSGCLERISSVPPSDVTSGESAAGEEDAGEAGPPESTAARSQFQRDARNAGATDDGLPEEPELRWKTRVEPVEGGLSTADGRVLVASTGTFAALDEGDGDPLWETEVGHELRAAPAVTDDTAYVTAWNGGGGHDHGLVAVALDDGRVRWRAAEGVDVTTAPTLADGTVYLGGSLDSADAIAIDAATGEEVWREEVGPRVTTPAAADGAVYVGGGEEPVVSALDAGDGSELWSTATEAGVWAAPTVVDGTVYVGTRTGRVHALDAATGERVWDAEVDTDLHSSVAADGEAVYVAGAESVTALAADGAELWSVEAPGRPFPPTVAGDDLLVADGSVARCLDAAAGSERWAFEVEDRAVDDMLFTGLGCEGVVADGSVYLASQGGDVYTLA